MANPEVEPNAEPDNHLKPEVITMDKEQENILLIRRKLRKNRMAVLPGSIAARSRSPFRRGKQSGLGVIVENLDDSGDPGVYSINSDKQSIVPPSEGTQTPEKSRRFSLTSSFPGFVSSGSEFIKSWSQYSLPMLESTQSVMSLPEVESSDRRSTAIMFGVNLQSMVLGTSVLSFPFAYLKGGIYAIPLTFVIGILACFTGSTLAECLYQPSSKIPGIRKRVHNAFVDICIAVWPKYGKVVMEAIVYFSLARNTVVLVLLTDILMEILKDFSPFSDERIWTCLWAIAVLPFLFISRVSALAWVSFIGLILYLLAIFALLISMALCEHAWNFKFLTVQFDLQGIGLATGIILNSFSQHLAFPALEGSMQNPANYKITLQLTFIINILLKIMFGMVGVLNFGPLTAQSITGNLPDNPYISTPIRIAIMFFTYFTIPMQSFVTFHLLDRQFLPYFPLLQNNYGDGTWIWFLLSRSLMFTACLLLGVLIPDFGVILGIIGSIRGGLVALIFPALFHYILFHKTSKWNINVLDISCVVVGCIFCGLGLYGSLRELFGV